MARFFVGRAISSIVTLLVIATISFFLIRFAPGSPFSNEKALPPEVVKDLEAKYGFDKPVVVQFANYLGNLLRGDMGLSTKYPQRTVNEIILDGFPVTLVLAAFALVWALLIGISAGIIGAVRQNTVWDYSAMTAAMLGISFPTFVLGPVLVLLFALSAQLLPSAGWGTWRHVVLPALTLGTIRAAYIARLTRVGLLDIVEADFIRTATAKGLKEQTIIWRHMLKGGLLPVVTYLGPMISFMLVGSIVVEKIFNTPGIGPYLIDATTNRDIFLMMGIVLLSATFLLVMNFVVDILYRILDPRIKYE